MRNVNCIYLTPAPEVGHKEAAENREKRDRERQRKDRASDVGSDLAEPLGRVVIHGNKPSRGTE
jgi:hypothetical protein